MFTILYHSAYTTIYYLGRFGLPVSCLQLNAVYSTHLSVHDVRALGMHTGTCVSVTFSILGLNILRKDRSSLDLYSNDHFYQQDFSFRKILVKRQMRNIYFKAMVLYNFYFHISGTQHPELYFNKYLIITEWSVVKECHINSGLNFLTVVGRIGYFQHYQWER